MPNHREACTKYSCSLNGHNVPDFEHNQLVTHLLTKPLQRVARRQEEWAKAARDAIASRVHAEEEVWEGGVGEKCR